MGDVAAEPVDLESVVSAAADLSRCRQLLDALPIGIYTTDTQGRITHFNQAAVAMCGRTPEIGIDRWCVSWKLYHPDGTPMPHEQCPMAVALKERRAVRGQVAIAERPDGTRFWFEPYPTPLFDAEGNLTGGINLLLDITARKTAETELLRNADDASLLREISAELIHQADEQALYQKIVDAAVSIMRSQYASMQMLYPERGDSGELRLLAFHGFDPQAAKFWEWVRTDSKCTCGLAMKDKHRIIDPDIACSKIMAGSKDQAALLRAGMRAAQSTPLITRGGALVGMISTHWDHPHQPTERDLRNFDILARQAADLIERRRAEEALRKSGEQLAADADALATLNELGSRLWRKSGLQEGIQEMLEATVKLLGADMGNVQLLEGDVLHIAAQRGFQQDFLDFFREVSTAEESACARALRTGERIMIPDVEADEAYAPMRAIARSAGYRAVQSVPLIGRDGRPRGIISMHWRTSHAPGERQLRHLDLYVRQATDFIERLEAEQAVKFSEERFRMIADNMGQLAWTCDRLGIVTWYNRRWLDYTGLTFEEMKDWGWKRCLPPDHVDRVVAGVTHSRETGKNWEDTFPLRGADGEYRWFLSRAYPIRDEAGNIVRWFGTNTDVTEQLAAEEDLRRAKETAEAANRSKDLFLATLSHELRTPLSPVLMTVAAIQEHPDLPGELREDMAMIRRNIELETRLIDDLLDLSRVISGKMRLEIQPTHVHSAIRHAVKNCESDTLAKRLNVRLDLHAERDLVSADPARLQQVIWNLVRNAAKFTPEGGEIRIRTQSGDGKVTIEVRDNGVGIPPEFLPRIFDAFEQGDIKTARRFGGLGLGLAICKAMVDMHGGMIRAESEGRGRGATFTVELMTTACADRESPHGSLPAGQDGNGRLRLLLVEDHPDTREVLARLLRGSKYAVQTAGSVAAALQLADTQRFDIVVSDLGLPDGTGYELMKEIRARHGIQGIALSGYGMEEDHRRSREAGFLDHIVKPVNVAQLEEVIQRAAGQVTA